MKKNVASQVIGAQMITAADGTAFTGSVSVAVTVDGGTQGAGGGTAPASEGNGFHSYTPTQAETNGDHIAFTFTGTGAIPATLQVYTQFPQTVDNDTKISLAATASALATVDTNVDSILVDTGTTLPGQISGLNDVAATDIVSAGAITTLSGAVVNVDLVDTVTTNTDMRGTDSASTAASVAALNDISVSDVLTTAMGESYAADGSAPTLAQAIFLIQQTIGDFSIAGTTVTVKKLNGSTTAATYTLDDATEPTSRTRAS